MQDSNGQLFPLANKLKYSGEREKCQVYTYSLDEAVDSAGFGIFQHKLLFILGLGWAADAAEIVVLSIVGPILACDWQLYRWQLAVLTVGVFVGMGIGSPVFGMIADRHGRKLSITTALTVAFLFGAASAIAPSYYWMLLFRTCTGFGLSGLPQGLTLCCEYFPTNIRGKAGFYLNYYWSLGIFVVVLISWVLMEQTKNWRILLIVVALPTLISLLASKWLVESVRFYMVSNKYEEAQNLVDNLALSNKKELPPGHLTMIEKCDQRGRITDLFTPEYRRSTILFCYLSAASAFAYYGITFVSPYIVENGNIYFETKNITSDLENFGEMIPCRVLSRQNYIDLLWTSAAELPSILVFTIICEKCSRKKLLGGACLTCAILIFLMLIKTNTKMIILLFLFGARGILCSVYQLTYVMLSESFPTTQRAVALGLGGAFAKLGGLLNSYVSQVLIMSDPLIAIGILGGVLLVAVIATACLPRETRGELLVDSHIKRKSTLDG